MGVHLNDAPFFPIAEGRPKSTGETLLMLPGITPVSQSTKTLVANTLYFEPIEVTTPITIDAIVCEVSTGAAGAARLGIYNADTNWQPTTLVVDGSTIDTTAAAVKTRAITARALPPGRYLLAYVSDATPVLRSVKSGTFTGSCPTLGASALPINWNINFAYAALPASTSWDTVTYSTTPFSHAMFLSVVTP